MGDGKVKEMNYIDEFYTHEMHRENTKENSSSSSSS
jgi:hypothetical protein